jgi:hypothetical protein
MLNAMGSSTSHFRVDVSPHVHVAATKHLIYGSPALPAESSLASDDAPSDPSTASGTAACPAAASSPSPGAPGCASPPGPGWAGLLPTAHQPHIFSVCAASLFKGPGSWLPMADSIVDSAGATCNHQILPPYLAAWKRTLNVVEVLFDNVVPIEVCAKMIHQLLQQHPHRAASSKGTERARRVTQGTLQIWKCAASCWPMSLYAAAQR